MSGNSIESEWVFTAGENAVIAECVTRMINCSPDARNFTFEQERNLLTANMKLCLLHLTTAANAITAAFNNEKLIQHPERWNANDLASLRNILATFRRMTQQATEAIRYVENTIRSAAMDADHTPREHMLLEQARNQITSLEQKLGALERQSTALGGTQQSDQATTPQSTMPMRTEEPQGFRSAYPQGNIGEPTKQARPSSAERHRTPAGVS